MKTFKNLLSIVFVLTFTLTAYSALVVPATPEAGTSSEFSGQLVKATFLNGEWIPVVDLPEVEITATRNGASVHKGVIRHGEVIAEVELPAVEITGVRIHDNSQMAAEEKSYERIYDIPVIEIESTFPLNRLSQAEQTDDVIMAVINLDEVTISFAKNESKNEVEPYTFAISTESGNNYLAASVVNADILTDLSHDLQGDQIYKYYSIAVDNCIVTEQRQKICNLIVKMSNTAMEGMKANILNAISK